MKKLFKKIFDNIAEIAALTLILAGLLFFAEMILIFCGALAVVVSI